MKDRVKITESLLKEIVSQLEKADHSKALWVDRIARTNSKSVAKFVEYNFTIKGIIYNLKLERRWSANSISDRFIISKKLTTYELDSSFKGILELKKKMRDIFINEIIPVANSKSEGASVIGMMLSENK